MGDFGVALMKSKTDEASIKLRGSLLWLAVETLKDGDLLEASDVYSTAIVMFEIAALQYPYLPDPKVHFSSLEDLADQIQAGLRPRLDLLAHEPVPQGYLDLMQACWHSDPGMRPTAQQAQQILQVVIDQGAAAFAVDASATFRIRDVTLVVQGGDSVELSGVSLHVSNEKRCVVLSSRSRDTSWQWPIASLLCASGSLQAGHAKRVVMVFNAAPTGNASQPQLADVDETIATLMLETDEAGKLVSTASAIAAVPDACVGKA